MHVVITILRIDFQQMDILIALPFHFCASKTWLEPPQHRTAHLSLLLRTPQKRRRSAQQTQAKGQGGEGTSHGELATEQQLDPGRGTLRRPKRLAEDGTHDTEHRRSEQKGRRSHGFMAKHQSCIQCIHVGL